jgi:hypothetical protein
MYHLVEIIIIIIIFFWLGVGEGWVVCPWYFTEAYAFLFFFFSSAVLIAFRAV